MNTTLTPWKNRMLSDWFDVEPFRGFGNEMNELMARMTGDLPAIGMPKLDLAETDGELHVTMDVPGIRPEDLSVEVKGDILYVSGKSTEEKKEEGKHFHRVERRSGEFHRTVPLPAAVNPDAVNAELKDGVLTITLPKVQEAVTKKVAIRG